MKKWLVLILLLLPASGMFGILLNDRGTRYDPFYAAACARNGILPSTYGWGQFGRYFQRTDNDHFWNARLGAYAEFFRLQNRFSLVVNSDLELVSSSNNFIYFEPRAFFWQEGLIFYTKLPFATLGVGYIHRCKHDIDNVNIYVRDNVFYERIPIWDSVVVKFTAKPLVAKVARHLDVSLMPFIDNHYYVLWQDGILDEYIYTNRGMTYTNLIDTISYGFRFEAPLNTLVRWYFQPQGTIDFYHNVEHDGIVVTADWFIETGFGLRGNGYDFDVCIAYESFFDAGVNPYLEHGRYWYLGIKLH